MQVEETMPAFELVDHLVLVAFLHVFVPDARRTQITALQEAGAELALADPNFLQ